MLLGLPSYAATPGCVVQARQAIRSMCPGCMGAEQRGGRGTGRTLRGAGERIAARACFHCIPCPTPRLCAALAPRNLPLCTCSRSWAPRPAV